MAPIVSFVDLEERAVITEPLSYGSIQVAAFDPDAGTSNGDGVARVRMRIFDADTGELVARRNEYRPTYDFGPALPDGTYRLEATATVTIVLDASAPAGNLQPTVPPPPGTVPPTTVPPTTVPPTTPPTVEIERAAAASLAAAYFNDAWVNSPGHYANMTNSRYTEVGIGLYRDESGWWATHVFR